jgi:hypothetical protein
MEKFASTVPQKALQTSKQIVAPALKAGIDEVAPGYSALAGEYGQLANLAKNVVKPLRLTPASVASVLGFGAGSAIGGPGTGLAASSILGPITLLATNPYLKFLLRKGGGELLNLLQYPARAGIGAGAGALLNQYGAQPEQ